MIIVNQNLVMFTGFTSWNSSLKYFLSYDSNSFPLFFCRIRQFQFLSIYTVILLILFGDSAGKYNEYNAYNNPGRIYNDMLIMKIRFLTLILNVFYNKAYKLEVFRIIP